QYNLPFKQFVTITIMDNTGIQVAELVHEEKEAGSYQTTFNADNLSAGIYFCKIATKNGFEIKKIILYK
ncbi:MAG: T9SS type A sorting domain-containing protein, partial [Ferruginibacter sp.]